MGSQKIVFSVLLATFLCLSTAGCIILPLGIPGTGVDWAATIKVGSTTRAEVLDLLYKPEINQGRFIVGEEKSGVVWFAFGKGGVEIDVRNRLLFQFDDNDVVERFEMETRPGKRYPLQEVQPSQALPRIALLRESGYYSVAVSPDGKLVAAYRCTGSTDNCGRCHVRLVNLRTQDQSCFSVDGNVVSLAFSPDGGKLAFLARTVRLLDVLTGKQIVSFGGHGDSIIWRFRGATSLAFAPNGKTVATGGGEGEIKLWDPLTGAEQLTFKAHDGWVSSVAFSPDGSLLATVGTDNAVRLWDPATGSQLMQLRRTVPADTVAFSPSGQLLAITTYGHVEVWRIVSKRGLEHGPAKFAVEGPVNMFIMPVVNLVRGRTPEYRGLAVSFSPNGRFVAACAGGASIWDIETSRQIWRKVPERNWKDPEKDLRELIYDCSFSPDGVFLATAAYDGVSLWDLYRLKGNPTSEPHALSGPRMSPRGR